MEDKVKIVNLVSGRVTLISRENNLKRTWERKGAVKSISYDQLEEAFNDPGVESLFLDGILGIEDMKVKQRLGLEPEEAETPQNVIILTDAQRKRYLTVMPLGEFKTEIQKLPIEQIKELANYAVENELTNSFDKLEVLKDITGIDVIKTIQLNKQDVPETEGEK